LTKQDNGKTLTLLKDSLIEITLDGNPTIGYQ